METFTSRFKKSVFLIILFIIVLFILFSTQKPDRDLRWYEKWILYVSSKVQESLSGGINGVISVGRHYFFLIDVKKENEQLIKRNSELTEKIHSQKEIEIENERLRNLLDFKKKVSPFMVPAEVIAVDVSEEFRTIRINKGERDNIKKDQAVVTTDGIVGKIFRVFGEYSDVLTILDQNSSVHGLVQRSRAKGIVDGKLKSVCRLKYIQRMEDVKMDDVVETSGLDGIFPKGLVIGKISHIAKQRYAITQDIEVTPSVDFGKLEELFVVTKLVEINIEPAAVADPNTLKK